MRTFRLQPSKCRALFENLYQNIVPELFAGCLDWEIVLRPYKSQRSIEQNKRLWKICQTLAESVFVNGRQFDSEVWHEYCKRTFIGYNEMTLPSGEVTLQAISTTTLNTAEMTTYQNQIQAWAALEHGIVWDF